MDTRDLAKRPETRQQIGWPERQLCLENDIASLTVDQLQTPVQNVKAGQSFSQKLRMRSEIRGLIVRHGMPAFWITTNLSDLVIPSF
jgi:hypothetical protein